MTRDELIKVRDALFNRGPVGPDTRKAYLEALALLDRELAAPEQEPVAWSHPDFDFAVMGKAPVNPPIEEWTPLVPLGSKSPAHQPAKPEPEPVAYWNKECMFCRADEVSDTPNWTDYYPYPLYAAPPAAKEWVGLTDEEILPEIKKCANYYGYINKPMHLTAGAGFFGLARAIESALRAKNTGGQA